MPWDLPAGWKHLRLVVEATGWTWPSGRSNLAYVFPDGANSWRRSVLYVPANERRGDAAVRVQERGSGAKTLGTGAPGTYLIVYEAWRGEGGVVEITGPVSGRVVLEEPPDTDRLWVQVSGTGEDAVPSVGWTWTVRGEAR